MTQPSSAINDGDCVHGSWLPQFVVVICLIISLGCKPTSRPIQGAPNQIAETKGLVFVAPDGFEERPAEKLYYHRQYRASIRPAYEPGANFDQKAAEFTEENLQQQGMTLDEKRIEVIDGRKTLFVKGRRINAPYPQVCLISLFPTQNGCAQLIAIHPADTAPEVAASIEKSITHAKYGE
jgi:hypothetical protein